MDSIQDSAITLNIYGTELDIDEINQWLNCEPSDTLGSWNLESELPKGAAIEAKIVAILDKTNPDPEVWARLNQKYKVRLVLGIFLYSSGECFAISPEMVKRLADRGLKLDFDLYTMQPQRG